MSDKIIYLDVFRAEYGKENCEHKKTFIDTRRAYVICRDCGVELSPMWVLEQLAHNESRFERERKLYMETIELLNKKKRTKCRHCGKMTDVRV